MAAAAWLHCGDTQEKVPEGVSVAAIKQFLIGWRGRYRPLL